MPRQPTWLYRRFAPGCAIEICTVHGRSVALPAHFHDEDQITFVLAGRRRFLMQNEIVSIAAGEIALIAAGIVHASLDEPTEMHGINLYLPVGTYDTAALAGALTAGVLRDLPQQARGMEAGPLAALLQRYRLGESKATPASELSRATVAERAAALGLSREGFSRAFTRTKGMPPHAFGLVSQLNQARDLLRHGEPLAGAALEAGFADQSHLGRCFKRIFGVTPGQYRHAYGASPKSQAFQTPS